MAKCKFCKKPVTVSPTYHAACMAQAAEEVMEAICEGYCKYPFIMDELELEEQCADCGLAAQLAALGA